MIIHLQHKPTRNQPMVPAKSLNVSTKGIANSVSSSPLRQVLIVPHSTLLEFGLAPGDLRENLVVDDTSLPQPLHDLTSGTVLTVGGVRIRLTVHCEPCGRLSSLVPKVRMIMHKRGYLGTFLADGVIHIGDSVCSEGQQHEIIPYDIKERIAWYLRQRKTPVEVSKLVYDVGLSLSYCRAIPKLTKGLGLGQMILFKRDRAIDATRALFE